MASFWRRNSLKNAAVNQNITFLRNGKVTLKTKYRYYEKEMRNNSVEKYFLTTYRKPKLHDVIKTTKFDYSHCQWQTLSIRTLLCVPLCHELLCCARAKLWNVPWECMAFSLLLLCHSVAHGTPADPAEQIAGFKSLWALFWGKHFLHGGKPKAVFISEIVTGPAAVTLEERIVAKIAKTRARRGKSLACTTSAGPSVLQ